MASQLESIDVNFFPHLEGKYIQSISLFQGQLFAGCIFPVDPKTSDSSCILSSGLNAIELTGVYGEEPADPHRISSITSGASYAAGLRTTGCPSLAVFKRRSESAPALYACILSATGSRLLVSRDGKSFDGIPSLAGGAVARSITAFNDRLFSAAIEEKTGSVLFVTDDPVGGDWRRAADAGFGDAENMAITSMAEFNGHLYAGTFNPYSGFQVWCSAAEGEAPYKWHLVIGGGALRYVSNMAAVSMVEFDGALYVGTGSPQDYDAMDGTEQEQEAAELIRIYQDNSWDIVAGSPRFSPDGLKVPMGAIGPGFDDGENIAIGTLVVHRGRLYAGTYSAKLFDTKNGSCGYDLWVTADGDDWFALSMDVPESGRTSGVTAMASTRDSLVLAASDLVKSYPLCVTQSRRSTGQQGKAAGRTTIARLFKR